MTVRRACEVCSRGGTFPLFGPGLSRRHFFRVAGTTIVGSYFADVLSPPRLMATVAPSLHGTARNAFLFFLAGAPSHSDMWDLKEGAWTPTAMAPTSWGDLRFPQGLLPKTAEQLPHLAFLRSFRAWALVHTLAQTWGQIARNPAGVLGNISPHIGAVVSLEMQARRQPADILPGFVGLNAGSMIGSGYLPSRYAPFVVSRTAPTGFAAFSHPDGHQRFADRWNLLQSFDPDRTPDGPLGKAPEDMVGFYEQADALIDSPAVNALFSYSNGDYARYGGSAFGGAVLVGKQLLAANQGCRFVQVTLGGWDNHSNIYGTNGSGALFTACKQLDPALGALVSDLAAAPGASTGRSLLDETLVIVVGEFGRTVGPLNGGKGRDHYLQMAVALAGGGVQGGKVIGTTDATASKTVDPGWSGNRDIKPEDLACTIYSALGIDYTTVRHDDPLGRGFEYVPFAKDGLYKPVDELF